MRRLATLLFTLLVSASAAGERAKHEDALNIPTPRVVFEQRESWRSVHVRNIADGTGYYEVYMEPARHLFEPAAGADEIDASPLVTQASVGAGVQGEAGLAGMAQKGATRLKAVEPEAEPARPEEERMDEVPAHLLEELVEVSTDRLVIRADEEQILELHVRRPRGLPDGEYHSRLVFRQLPSPEQAREQEAAEAEQLAALEAVPADQIYDEGPVKIRVKRPEYSVPVLVRQGAHRVVASLTNPELYQNEEGLWLAVTLHRAGSRSLFGDFKLYGQSYLKSRSEVLMIRKYVALDIPETERVVRLQLPPELDLVLYEQLQLEFRERRRFGGTEGAKMVIDLTDQ